MAFIFSHITNLGREPFWVVESMEMIPQYLDKVQVAILLLCCELGIKEGNFSRGQFCLLEVVRVSKLAGMFPFKQATRPLQVLPFMRLQLASGCFCYTPGSLVVGLGS